MDVHPPKNGINRYWSIAIWITWVDRRVWPVFGVDSRGMQLGNTDDRPLPDDPAIFDPLQVGQTRKSKIWVKNVQNMSKEKFSGWFKPQTAANPNSRTDSTKVHFQQKFEAATPDPKPYPLRILPSLVPGACISPSCASARKSDRWVPCNLKLYPILRPWNHGTSIAARGTGISCTPQCEAPQL
jgi:hypothetical protein